MHLNNVTSLCKPLFARVKPCLGVKNVFGRFMKPVLGKGECYVIVDLSCQLPGSIAINRSDLCKSVGCQELKFVAVRDG